MAEKKQSEKAIEACVDHMIEYAPGIQRKMLMDTVMEPIRTNFEKYLDTPDPKTGEALWRTHWKAMKNNCRYLATLAEFFALNDGGICENHLGTAFEMVRVQCKVGKRDEIHAQFIYCDGGGKATAVQDVLAVFLKP